MWRPQSPRHRGHTGIGKVVTNEQQRFTARHRERVAEAVAQVERRAVAATTKRSRGITHDRHLININRHDLRLDAAKQGVELNIPSLTKTPTQGECGFDDGSCRDHADRGLLDRRNESRSSRLVQHDGDQCGRIDDHDSSARYAVLVIAEEIVGSACGATRVSRSSRARRIASVMDSPVASASARANRSVSGSLILSAIFRLSINESSNIDRSP